MTPFACPAVANVFMGYPKPINKKLLLLRELIFTIAATTNGVGTLEETLKWGEPAYLTTATKSGSTIRLGHKKTVSPTMLSTLIAKQI